MSGRLCGRGIDLSSFYHCNILFCSDSVVLFVLSRQCDIVCFVQTVWYCLFCSDSVVLFVLFRQCGIVCFVQTVWYCLFCSDSVILFVLFRQCDIVCFVQTVWYCLVCFYFINWYFSFFFVIYNYAKPRSIYQLLVNSNNWHENNLCLLSVL